jgi:hypothetical protein
MSLHFEERSYAGNQKHNRPRPEIHIDQESGLLIVATPWGARSGAENVIQHMNEYLSLARGDREATSPFERLSCLSTQANNLRIAALLANQALYRDDNREEYRTGVELFAATMDDNEMVWLQAGNPQILLSRDDHGLLPIGAQVDLAFDLSYNGQMLAPLPAQLLGLDITLNLTLNSFRARPGDRVVLLSHSYMPQVLFSIESKDTNLDSITRNLSKLQPNHAFWLGILSIESKESAA